MIAPTPFSCRFPLRLRIRLRIRPGIRPRISPSRSGITLFEVVLALAVLGVLLAIATPGGRGMLDRLAVVSAREEIVGMVHRARALGLEAGGATIRIDVDADVLSLVASDATIRGRLDLATRGVDLTTTGSASVVDLGWNALGWGVVASRTLVLRRGAAEARVVVSSRGRATRR